MKTFFALCFSFLLAAPAWAAEKVSVMALFTGKAMLSIDGRNRLLRAGQTSPEGVKLISADPRQAVVLLKGEMLTLQPGGGVQASYKKPELREVRITRNNQGAYTSHGSINGRAVAFLVDTGASSVAMSAVVAKSLGIPYLLEGRRAIIGTASGQATGYQINLDRVQLGEVVLSDVEGVVIEADAPQQVLLGMSFLQRLEMSQKGNMMMLRQR